MDFGIARALYDTGATMTQTAAVIGTAQYLSPEQARGEQADARSDLYSTGCLLYELLTGRPPFVGDSLVSVAVAHVRDEPQPPSAHDPSIPPEIDHVVLTALAKDREARYQSAEDMRADIERVLAGTPPNGTEETAATELIPRALPVTPPDDDVVPLGDREDEPRRRGWWAVVLLGLLAVALAATVGWLVFRGDPGPERVEVPGVVGQQRAAAERALVAAGMAVEVRSRNDADVPSGQVSEQDPLGGTLHPRGTTVTITVSLGERVVAVPVLQGLSLTQAEAKLTAAKLRLGRASEQPSTKPEDEVLSSDPTAGEEVAEGTQVAVTISSGQVEVPAVVGRPRADAEAALAAQGLRADVRPRADGSGEAGTVVEQAPRAGTLASQGDPVILYVAVAPAPTPTASSPSPTGSPTETGTPSPTSTP
jgi:serine/threonine-protein kinase